MKIITRSIWAAEHSEGACNLSAIKMQTGYVWLPVYVESDGNSQFQ